MALGADRLPPEVSSYVLAASGDEETARDNLEAFRRRRLRPRILTGLDDLSTETSVLGTDVAMPLGIAPMAEHALAHPDAELAMCRAAAEAGVPMCVSTASSVPLDRVAGVAAEADAPWWFQLYAGADREATTSLVRRAVGGGCAAVVLTVDVAVVGYRDRGAHHPALAAGQPLLRRALGAPRPGMSTRPRSAFATPGPTSSGSARPAAIAPSS